jgi:hypothetical protein
MALVPNQSYANADTPLFAAASVLTELSPTQWLSGPVTLGPLAPSTPTYVTGQPAYNTIAGKYYDITVLTVVDLDSGSSTGGDQMRVIANVDNASFGTTVGSFANDYRVGGTSTTYLTFTIRLLCTASGVLRIGYEATQVAGSTGIYECGVVSVLINEVP